MIKDKKDTTVTIRIKKEDKKWLDDFAFYHGLTLSRVIQEIIESFIRSNENS